jgi:hypothetical protein
MTLADHAIQMMLGHDCAEEELGCTQGSRQRNSLRLAAARKFFVSCLRVARSSGIEDRAKLWRAWRLGNRDTKKRSGVFPGHHPQQADSQIKEFDFGGLVSRKRTLRTGYLRRPPADNLRKQSFLASKMPI